MPAYKDKNNTWYVSFMYENWMGENKRKLKRGFKTRKDALSYERAFKNCEEKRVDIPLAEFLEIYKRDVYPRLKASTIANKNQIIEFHILPYFKKRKINEISSSDIIQWQNTLLSKRDAQGTAYSYEYIKKIRSQLSAVFNHAIKFYGLVKNPVLGVPITTPKRRKEMEFWTVDEYFSFRNQLVDKPVHYYAFETLFFTGMRVGELLALTMKDIDLKDKKIRINKTYQVLNGEQLITSPKTEKSNRIVYMPDFLAEELEDYLCSLYKCGEDERIFSLVSKSGLTNALKTTADKVGLKRIRIHDLRHSHVAYLINLGFQPIEIGARLGHETEHVTLTYAHLYPSIQKDMANKINSNWEKQCI